VNHPPRCKIFAPSGWVNVWRLSVSGQYWTFVYRYHAQEGQHRG
jgi:hypothetical protein